MIYTLTNHLSATFGFIFIVLAFIGLVAFIIATWRGANLTKLDKVMDAWKWTLGTLAVGVAASIVSDSFKQREADRNEMTAFSQFANIAIDSGTVDKKRRLCDFFIAVSPEGRLRDAWSRYSKTLDKVDAKTATLTKKENIIVNQIGDGKATDAQAAALSYIQTQKQQVLSEVGAIEPGPFLIIAGGDKIFEQAQNQLKKAQKLNMPVTLFQNRGMYRTVFTGLATSATAHNLLARVQSQVSATAYIVKQSSWCPNYHTTDNCIVCTL